MVRLYHSLRGLYSFPKAHLKTTIGCLLLLALLLFLSPFYKYLPTIFSLSRGFFFGDVSSLKHKDGRTNFLILGLGGPRNEPSSLTDTQQFLSYDHSNNRHVLLSIPRDIWIPELGVKINNAYSYGNSTEGNGSDLTKKAVEEITGQPIHYHVMIAFDGFVELINLLGGIDVDVERSFTDNRYPIRGKENDLCNGDPEYACRWETITFKKGLNHFDGETALKYVRSRHARGDEGTDFARAARQQKVLLAIKNKIISPNFLLNPKKIEDLVTLTGKVIDTNIPQEDLGLVARVFIQTRGEKINTQALIAVDPSNPDDNPSKPAFIIHPTTAATYKNQWVLVPIGGDWKPTNEWVKCLLENDSCPPEEFAPQIRN